MDKAEILKDLDATFAKTKEDLGFSSSFEDIERIFFIRDGVLKDGFVSESFSRQMCHRMVDLYMSWNNYLHGIIFPNPSYLINAAEAKIFDEAEKQQMNKLISGAMGLVSRNTHVGLTKDAKAEAALIDDCVKFWNETFQPELSKIIGKVTDNWNKE